MVYDKHRRCSQIKCSFFTLGGCQNCDECDSAPYNILPKCRRCIMCEGKSNYLRFGEQQSNQLDIQQPKENQEPKNVVMIVGEVP